RVIVMYAGKVVEEGPTKEVFENTQHPYTEGLIKSMPKIGLKQKRLYAITEQVPDPISMQRDCKFAARCTYVMNKCIENYPELLEVKEKKQQSRCWLTEEKSKGGETVES